MFNMVNSRMERGKNSPMVCKILSRMSASATVLSWSSCGARISLREWALGIAYFSRLAFELPSLWRGRHFLEFAAERTDSDHGYRF
jgi:tRNA(Phe) wybutosine-synthesizing methylase Tyw3